MGGKNKTKRTKLRPFLVILVVYTKNKKCSYQIIEQTAKDQETTNTACKKVKKVKNSRKHIVVLFGICCKYRKLK